MTELEGPAQAPGAGAGALCTVTVLLFIHMRASTAQHLQERRQLLAGQRLAPSSVSTECAIVQESQRTLLCRLLPPGFHVGITCLSTCSQEYAPRAKPCVELQRESKALCSATENLKSTAFARPTDKGWPRLACAEQLYPVALQQFENALRQSSQLLPGRLRKQGLLHEASWSEEAAGRSLCTAQMCVHCSTRQGLQILAAG